MENSKDLAQLIECVKIESKAQEEKFSVKNGANFKQLKAEGFLLHPIKITRKSYGYADYPELAFQVLYPSESNAFKNGASIQVVYENEEPLKGLLLYLDGNKGELRLFAPDFPDWLEDRGIGVQLTPDQRTNEVMLNALKKIEDTHYLRELFDTIHSMQDDQQTINLSGKLVFKNTTLNSSQQIAVANGMAERQLQIIHGPPGTGKTTTLVELIYQLHLDKKRILITAPSNTAVDHLGIQLTKIGLNFLRVGNNSKVNETLLPYTIEGKMGEAKLKTTIKNLRIRSEQLRKMANQYKRNFGKAERDQRKLLLQEVKNIRKEIRKLQTDFETEVYEQNSILIGTPIGINDCHFKEFEFDVLMIDEAGQCLEPLAWVLFDKAKRIILAGDPFQLPPTVISFEAEKKGLNISILEQLINNNHSTNFLDTQYRMTSTIAEYSNRYFYKGALKSVNPITENEISIHFYDSAGADFVESFHEQSFSIFNELELDFVPKIVENHHLEIHKTAFITPYSGQLQLAKTMLSNFKRVSTIDSFQGQEEESIIISLVRSNSEQQIGFLTDYRRMNVALTRAKKQLFIIGDSSTLGNDDFYSGLISFIESKNGYHSVWELSY